MRQLVFVPFLARNLVAEMRRGCDVSETGISNVTPVTSYGVRTCHFVLEYICLHYQEKTLLRRVPCVKEKRDTLVLVTTVDVSNANDL